MRYAIAENSNRFRILELLSPCLGGIKYAQVTFSVLLEVRQCHNCLNSKAGFPVVPYCSIKCLIVLFLTIVQDPHGFIGHLKH